MSGNSVSANSVSASSADDDDAEALGSRGKVPRMPFSEEENQFLREGVQRYGVGQWSAILNTYPFHPLRNAVALKDRWRYISLRADRAEGKVPKFNERWSKRHWELLGTSIVFKNRFAGEAANKAALRNYTLISIRGEDDSVVVYRGWYQFDPRVRVDKHGNERPHSTRVGKTQQIASYTTLADVPAHHRYSVYSGT
jgi:hypothetical protein